MNKSTNEVMAQQDEREAYCKACDGAGTVSTGISEASSTQCRKCDGTGVMQQDERKTVIGTALGGGNLTHSDCSGANCHICGGTGMPKKGEVLAQQVQADAGAVESEPTGVAAAIHQVRGALELCEPEDAAAFEVIVAALNYRAALSREQPQPSNGDREGGAV